MLIPDKINNFNVYSGEVTPTSKIQGVTDEVTLPTATYMSETINHAGFAGEIDSPTVGQLQSMEMEIPFANISESGMKIVADDAKPIVLKGAQEFIDSESRHKSFQGRTITSIGMTKAINFGSLKKSGAGNPSITKELTYYKDELEDAEGKKTTLTEIDKINGVFVINGVDMFSNINQFL